MPFKSICSRILVLTLFNFGLFSCAKDKSSRLDDFDLDGPILHAQVRSEGLSFKSNIQEVHLDTPLTEAIYPTSILEMPTLKNQNFAAFPISLKSISTCRELSEGSPERIYQIQFNHAKSFSLMNLIDPSFLVSMSLSGRNGECRFSFEFSNSIGSTESFHYSHIIIAPLFKTESFDIHLNSHDQNNNEFDVALPIVHENRDPAKIYPLTQQTKLGYLAQMGEKILLVCEDFRSEILANANGDMILSSFDNAPLVWNKNSNDADSRLTNPAQDCRVMVASGDSDHVLRYSRQFRLIFKMPELELHLNVNKKIFDVFSSTNSINPGAQLKYLELEIFNPSGQRVSISLPNIDVLIRFQANGSSNPANREISQSLSPSVSGGEFIETDMKFGKIFRLGASSKLRVVYNINFPASCSTVHFLDLNGSLRGVDDVSVRNTGALQIYQFANGEAPYQAEFYKSYLALQANIGNSIIGGDLDCGG